jgi:hypothetical protein
MSDTAMDTPADSQVTGGTSSRSNKPDTYNGDRAKLEAWLLQVDRYFHLEGDKIEDHDMVVWATSFLRGDAEKWASPIIRRYMDSNVDDDVNKHLVEDWDAFKIKMREVFSPFKESVIAEQKIQKLRQIRSAADYTTEFQQYQTLIEWDDNALMRMYRQGLKPTVRMELMRSGSSLNTLNELMAEAIRVDNELYELMLEERLYTNGNRAPQNTNNRARQNPRRSYPNQGRQRSYVPRIPGQYRTNGPEPMHLDNLNKGPGKPKFSHDKGNKKKFTCYACGKEGHMKRDCRSQGKVTRQLNVIRRTVPNNDLTEEWNVITRPHIKLDVEEDEMIDGLEDLTITKVEELSSDEDTSDSESLEDMEVTEIDQTKFGKMAIFKEENRPPTPHATEEQFQTLSYQINELLRYLNKQPIEYAYETPDIMAAMRQDFYNLSCQVEHDKENLPADILKFLPTPDELDWISRAIKTWNKPTASDKTEVIKCPEDLDFRLGVLRQQLGKPEYKYPDTKDQFYDEFEKFVEYHDLIKELKTQGTHDAEELFGWAYEAKASWEEPTHYLSDSEKQEIYEEIKKQTNPHESQMTDKEYESYRYWRGKDFDAAMAYKQVAKERQYRRQERADARLRRNNERRKRETETHYWLDPRNPLHNKMSWTACLHDSCTVHYSEKTGANYFPRKYAGMPICAFQWFDCPKDECAIHLWDKRHRPYFYGHEDPQETLQMHITQQKTLEDGTSAWECNQPSWHTCLNIECELHIVAKEFYGYNAQSFLDVRPKHREPERRSTA